MKPSPMLSMNFSLPINFTARQCDRLLVLNLAAREIERDSVLLMMLRCWIDFATAREDRRHVPLEKGERAKAGAVAILEDYIGWRKEPGGFVDAAIGAGFFMLTPLSESLAELVLVDFFPANANTSTLTNSERGGVNKAYRGIKTQAEIQARDHLELFKRTGDAPLSAEDERRTSAAIMLVHSICLALKRQAPEDEVWKKTLIEKAVATCREVPSADREAVLKWFVKNRQSQRIPIRLDFVLEQFGSFVPDARIAFGISA